MLNSIKKNWWLVLLGLLALFIVKYFLSSDEPEEQKLPLVSEPAAQDSIEEPKVSVPVEQAKEIPAPNKPAPVEAKDPIAVEPLTDDETPEKMNYVLCEYIVSGETQYEFTGQIRLINKGSKAVFGWSVSWEFEDGSTVIEATDVALGGSNPYTAEYLASNAEIAPGKTVTFGFTGVKGGDRAPLNVKIEGDFCM